MIRVSFPFLFQYVSFPLIFKVLVSNIFLSINKEIKWKLRGKKNAQHGLPNFTENQALHCRIAQDCFASWNNISLLVQVHRVLKQTGPYDVEDVIQGGTLWSLKIIHDNQNHQSYQIILLMSLQETKCRHF